MSKHTSQKLLKINQTTNPNSENLRHNEISDNQKDLEAHQESRNYSSSLGWSNSKHILEGGTNDPGNEK